VCGATPASARRDARERVTFLRKTVPLAWSRSRTRVSVVLGFLLLVAARGLTRG